MIPRYQRIAYWALIGGILLMFALLIRGCERNHQRILAMRDQSPIAAPTDLPNESVTVAMANDADGSVTLDQVSVALPSEPSLRARVLLDRVLTDLSLPNSAHRVPPGPAVIDVFFLPLPLNNPGSGVGPATLPTPDPVTASEYGRFHHTGDVLAVVNLTGAFASAHPSGIESEELTLRALIATLHANFPQVDQVRFTIDGATHDTLAGHADLSRAYGVQDPAKRIHVLSGDGSEL